MCVLCKINIVVGLEAFSILLKLFSNWLEEYKMHMRGQKECASEGFCIRRALHKRLSNMQID